MAEVIPLRGKRVFSLNEARMLLPVIRKVTHKSVQQTEEVVRLMESFESTSAERQQLENRLNGMIEGWAKRIERLGCEPKGLWLVDFDSGSRYYCWQYGEDDIGFSHGYDEGFAGRKPLSIKTIHPVP